ncbi:hypothetical protein [uncultured Porphyromonas sp.]|uniref:hypothetical protein n=1 Tax=uncultured Porphyromonas sp. TaxID=159274 RepID=UPI00262BE44D|nr:hypothetical protein [uncultured Porphyromonas sp.]
MKLTNSLIITALLGLFILPACGSNHSSNEKDSANAEQSVASGKEDVQQCALGLIRIEEEIAFEAILRDGKVWLRFPRSLREKIWDAYPIEEAPVPPFHYSANDEYEVSGLTDCAKIVFINRGQHQDNPMLYFIQKDGTVKVLSFLRAIWFGDFEALRHPTPQSEVADVVSRDEGETGYRSAFAILKNGEEVELDTSHFITTLAEGQKNSDGSPKSVLVGTDDFRIFFVTKSKNGLWQEALAGSFVADTESQEAEDVLNYHFSQRKTYSSDAIKDAPIDMRGILLGKWNETTYIVKSKGNTAPFDRPLHYPMEL